MASPPGLHLNSKAKNSQKLPVFVFPNRIDFIIDTTQHHKQVFTIHNPYDFPTKFKLLTTQKNRYKVLQREGVIQEKHCTDVLVRLHNDVFLQVQEENYEVQTEKENLQSHQVSSSTSQKYFSRDKLRFEVSDLATKNPLGHRDVDCFIWRTKSEFLEFSSGTGMGNNEKNFVAEGGGGAFIGNNAFSNLQNSFDSDNENTVFVTGTKILPGPISKQKSNRPSVYDSNTSYDTRYRGSIWVPVIAIVICLVILSIPKEEPIDPENPKSSHWFLPDFMLITSSENQRLIASYVLGILTMIIVQYQQT